MPFYLNYGDQALLLSSIRDRSLRHEVMKALSGDSVATSMQLRFQGALPLTVLGGWIGGLVVPGTWANLIRGAASALGSGVVVAAAHTNARALKRARRVELACLEAGELTAAAVMRGQVIRILAQMPYSRTRAAIACLDLINYGVAMKSADAVIMSAHASSEVLELLPPVGVKRFTRAVRDASDTVSSYPEAQDRVTARLGLIMMAATAGVRDIGPVMVDAATDMFTVGEANAAGLLNPLLVAVDKLGQEIDDDSATDHLRQCLESAEEYMTEGLRRTLAEGGAERADEVVRTVIRSDRMATRTVLDAYLVAMEQHDDERTDQMRRLMADGDAENRAALALIGISSERAPEPPGR